MNNIFKIALQNLFNIFILFNTASYFKFNFRLKIDPKMFTFKNLEKVWKKRVATLIKRRNIKLYKQFTKPVQKENTKIR